MGDEGRCAGELSDEGKCRKVNGSGREPGTARTERTQMQRTVTNMAVSITRTGRQISSVRSLARVAKAASRATVDTCLRFGPAS